MEANGGGAWVEGTGVSADDALAEIGSLQPLVGEIALDKLCHGPVEEEAAGLGIPGEEVFELIVRGGVADPHVSRDFSQVVAGHALRGAKFISQSAKDVAHGAPAFDIFRGEAANLFFASCVIVP